MGQLHSPRDRTRQALDLVRLTPLMARTTGSPEIIVGLIDGPVAGHADLSAVRVPGLPGAGRLACTEPGGAACVHGTFVAGMLAARRGARAPAICPGCTLIVRPIFPEVRHTSGEMTAAQPEDLARAIVEAARAGARILNMSVAIQKPNTQEQQIVSEALNYAARRGAILVAASGNGGEFGSTVITRHPGVIPVAACDLNGRPLDRSNIGRVVGTNGLMAPGTGISSLSPAGGQHSLSGTSVAAPFVTGALALLWSLFPGATAEQIRFGLRQAHGGNRARVVPPLLDAVSAYWSIAHILR